MVAAVFGLCLMGRVSVIFTGLNVVGVVRREVFHAFVIFFGSHHMIIFQLFLLDFYV